MNTAPATETTAVAPVELDLDARLAVVGALMDERLAVANVTFEVDTAHIPASEPIPEVVAPPLITPAPTPCPYRTPLATVLHQARVRLEAGGWCTGQLRDEEGAACLIGHIRAVAASRDQANSACAILREAIRKDFADAEIASWNDEQRDPRLPARYLERAAELAHDRGR